MTEQFKVTGERLTLQKSSKRNQEDHVARYEFAKEHASGKKVLDIACGTGYGARILKEGGATEVVGADIDPEAIAYAKENFAQEGVSFICGSASSSIFSEAEFDLVVSFETIEHLEDGDRASYLNNLKTWLKPGGKILLSTPNKLITSPWSEKPLNPYHVLEYYRDTLEQELGEHGLQIESWHGQRFVRKILTLRISYIIIRIFEKILRKNFGVYDIADSAEVRPVKKGYEPRYFMVLVNK